MSRLAFSGIWLMLCWLPSMLQAQGLLLVASEDSVRLPRTVIRPYPFPQPVPTASYKIKELIVDARLIDQVAQVQVSQTFVNTGSRPLEASFVFPMPYDGAIEQMTLLVDGREHPARLLDAAEARKMYEEIVRRNRDPALLEWVGAGLFRTSVFPVPPGASRTVSLRYSQLCRKQEGLTDFLFALGTAKYTAEAPEKIEIRTSIESQEDIKNIYSPSHAVEIKRPDAKHAIVTFSSKNEAPTGDFRLMYDVGRGLLNAQVLSYRPNNEDGYFMLLASPEIKSGKTDQLAKTVVFVVDRSGSMGGKKIEQVKDALKQVMNNLHPDDLFNIIAYDNQVTTFRPELQRYDEESRKAALSFVESVYAGGSTNIDAALQIALSQLHDAKRPNYVIFLTDGLPTAGETNEMKIIENTKKYNGVHARLFAFGVGYDVNSRLLDKLVRENYGQSEFVRPNEDIEQRIGNLYARIESPVLTGVQIQFSRAGEKTGNDFSINRIYPKNRFDLFAGEQLVIVGRYHKPGTAKAIVQGTVGDGPQSFEFPTELVAKSNDDNLAFVEKLWATRRVGEILDELDLNGKNEELVKELVELATRHGILTPYTSFMADENTNLHDMAANTGTTGERVRALEETSGMSGVLQRAMKGEFERAALAPPQAAIPMEAFASSNPARGTLLHKAAGEAYSAQQNIQNIGNRTFFRRQGQWIDSQVTELQQKNARRIKQFSNEYFELARSNGRQLSQYLVFDEPVLLNFGDQTYLIEPN